MLTLSASAALLRWSRPNQTLPDCYTCRIDPLSPYLLVLDKVLLTSSCGCSAPFRWQGSVSHVFPLYGPVLLERV